MEVKDQARNVKLVFIFGELLQILRSKDKCVNQVIKISSG